MPDHVLLGLNYKKTRNWQGDLSDLGDKKCAFVSEDDNGRIVGFSYGGIIRGDIVGFDCELYAIYITRGFQRKGIGKKLFMATVNWMMERGYSKMLVWVVKGNKANEWYEGLGGVFHSTKTTKVGDSPIEGISYGWSDLNIFKDSQ